MRDGLCLPGLTLDELAGLARHATKRRVTLLRDLTPQAFRQELVRSNRPGSRYVAVDTLDGEHKRGLLRVE